MKNKIFDRIKILLGDINKLNTEDKVSIINDLRFEIHKHSPFANEPIDYVKWVKVTDVKANNYNPNTVAPPEMELLRHSISHDGYTQPVVTWENGDGREVVDGFHRTRVCKECSDVSERVFNYLPVVGINDTCKERNDRIASTIRHNRARGKHQVNSMSDIVLELKNRNWKNKRIAKELGMDEDEILRLCQITGLASLFEDDDFSKSWDIEDSEIEFEPLVGQVNEEEKEKNGFRTVNTSDKDRVFHTYDKWECYKAGFYNTHMDGMTKEECEQAYADFLSNEKKFSDSLEKVITEWKNSCEHYLTNISMNRIAWLGQAAMCYSTGIPHVYRSGFFLLTEKQQDTANKIACEFLNIWLMDNNMKSITLEEAMTNKQVSLY